MIDLETIEREINTLEARGDTTYSQCERLAWLYVVRDHIRPARGDEKTQDLRGSEFLEACSDRSDPGVMRGLNEHMEALKIVQPREYEAVMAKIRDV